MLQVDRQARWTIDRVAKHEWTVEGYGDAPETYIPSPRQYIEFVDPDLIKRLVTYGFSQEASEKAVRNNSHGPALSLYHLMLEKQARDDAEERKRAEQERVLAEQRNQRILAKLARRTPPATATAATAAAAQQDMAVASSSTVTKASSTVSAAMASAVAAMNLRPSSTVSAAMASAVAAMNLRPSSSNSSLNVATIAERRRGLGETGAKAKIRNVASSDLSELRSRHAHQQQQQQQQLQQLQSITTASLPTLQLPLSRSQSTSPHSPPRFQSLYINPNITSSVSSDMQSPLSPLSTNGSGPTSPITVTTTSSTISLNVPASVPANGPHLSGTSNNSSGANGLKQFVSVSANTSAVSLTPATLPQQQQQQQQQQQAHTTRSMPSLPANQTYYDLSQGHVFGYGYNNNGSGGGGGSEVGSPTEASLLSEELQNLELHHKSPHKSPDSRQAPQQHQQFSRHPQQPQAQQQQQQQQQQPVFQYQHQYQYQHHQYYGLQQLSPGDEVEPVLTTTAAPVAVAPTPTIMLSLPGVRRRRLDTPLASSLDVDVHNTMMTHPANSSSTSSLSSDRGVGLMLQSPPQHQQREKIGLKLSFGASSPPSHSIGTHELRSFAVDHPHAPPPPAANRSFNTSSPTQPGGAPFIPVEVAAALAAHQALDQLQKQQQQTDKLVMPGTVPLSAAVPINHGLRRSTVQNDAALVGSSVTPTAPQQQKKQQQQQQQINYANLRSVKGLFNVSTSSSRPPADIAEELKRVLAKSNVTFQQNNFIFHCLFVYPLVDPTGSTSTSTSTSTTAFTTSEEKTMAGIRFDIEICRIQNLMLFGLHLNRIDGDQWAYKRLCDQLTSQLRI